MATRTDGVNFFFSLTPTLSPQTLRNSGSTPSYFKALLSVVVDIWLPGVLIGVRLEVHLEDQLFKFLGIPENQVGILAYYEDGDFPEFSKDDGDRNTEKSLPISHSK